MRAFVTVDSRWGIAKLSDNFDGDVQYTTPWGSPIDNLPDNTNGDIKKIIVGLNTYKQWPVLQNYCILCVSHRRFANDNWYNLANNTAFASVSIDDAKKLALADTTNKILLAGGLQMYEQLLPYCNRLCVTQIHADYSCELKFPVEMLKLFKPDERAARQTVDRTFTEYTKIIL